MICIFINNLNQIHMTRALTSALDEPHQYYLHFSSERLLKLYGNIPYKHGTDIKYVFMNGQHFKGLITFAVATHYNNIPALLLTSYFNEIGVITIEIQHGLFQYGIDGLTHQTQRCGFDTQAGGFGLPPKYPAKHLIKWGGKEGIGYLKSEQDFTDFKPLPAKNYTLITSNIHWHLYTAEERTNFLLAIQTLIKENPDRFFIWKPHDMEHQHIKDANIKSDNLLIINRKDGIHYPAERLVRSCEIGISNLSTTLIDYDHQDKSVLVFRAKNGTEMLKRITCETFENEKELTEKFNALLKDKKRGKVDTKIPPLKKTTLKTKINTYLAETENKFSIKIATPYCTLFDQATLDALHKKDPKGKKIGVREIGIILENISAKLARENHIDPSLLKILKERFEAMQRSTLAYKFKKLLRFKKQS
ncbi:MAG: hypothetical protein ACTSXQ_05850 [Alphaproteobacteria bacterium]